MRACTVNLQNPDTSHRQWITVAEAQRRERNGEIFRVSRLKDPKMVFRLRVFASPSNSLDSPPCLTRSDMDALAGLRKMTEIRQERLEGWGLITSVKVKISSAKAEAYGGGARAVHYLVDEVEQMEQEVLAQEALPENSAFLA